jgi:hypothetical protein
LIIAVYSIKLAFDAQRHAAAEETRIEMEAKTLGVFVSPLDVHQRLMYDLVATLKKK